MNSKKGVPLSRIIVIGPGAGRYLTDEHDLFLFGTSTVDCLRVDFQKKTIEINDKNGMLLRADFSDELETPSLELRGNGPDLYGHVVSTFQEVAKAFYDSFVEEREPGPSAAQRAREAAQTLIAEIGAPGPESVVITAQRAVDVIVELKEKLGDTLHTLSDNHIGDIEMDCCGCASCMSTKEQLVEYREQHETDEE